MKPALLSTVRSLGVASLGGLAFFASAFFVWPGSWISDVFLWPGFLLLPLIGPTLPDRLVYFLVPDGGGPAAVMVVAAGSLLTWGAVSLLGWSTLKRVASLVLRGWRTPAI